MLHAKNGTVTLDGAKLAYVAFGRGAQPLVMLPGLGDGMRTVEGMALPFALLYRGYARQYRVYVFSRKTPLPAVYTTRQMAQDQARAMRALGIGHAHVLGASQGGMIAQWLALDAPELVDRLVLAVTMGRPSETARQVIRQWLALAQQGDARGILTDIMEKAYTERYLRGKRWLYPLLVRLGAPKSLARFCTQANACLTHDAWAQLPQLRCPTLVLGAEKDCTVGVQASLELAGRIPGCAQHIFAGYGHGVYDEAKDFARRVRDFLAQPGRAENIAKT